MEGEGELYLWKVEDYSLISNHITEQVEKAHIQHNYLLTVPFHGDHKVRITRSTKRLKLTYPPADDGSARGRTKVAILYTFLTLEIASLKCSTTIGACPVLIDSDLLE